MKIGSRKLCHLTFLRKKTYDNNSCGFWIPTSSQPVDSATRASVDGGLRQDSLWYQTFNDSLRLIELEVSTLLDSETCRLGV